MLPRQTTVQFGGGGWWLVVNSPHVLVTGLAWRTLTENIARVPVACTVGVGRLVGRGRRTESTLPARGTRRCRRPSWRRLGKYKTRRGTYKTAAEGGACVSGRSELFEEQLVDRVDRAWGGDEGALCILLESGGRLVGSYGARA